MRWFFTVAFIAVCLIALPQHGHGASMTTHAIPSNPLLIDAKFVCGQFDGSYTCKYVPGSIDRHKNPSIVGPTKDSTGQTPGPSTPPSPDGSWGATTNQPPSRPPGATAQSCPPNTELLGGNCVPYTARCKNGLALDALPQPCASMEEKQVCRPRADGLKDCCCITYSKF
ncbi:MAG: hypothetical protein FJX44_09190 [Alphaproteobacteria bacterium]|nr:hypothetical protein [Alphaproteobacteria bacterium]